MTKAEAEQVMKRCQIGDANIHRANDLLAECYGTIGALLHQQAHLVRHTETLINCADHQRDLQEIREARAYIRSLE
jgi:hypothetical protein